MSRIPKPGMTIALLAAVVAIAAAFGVWFIPGQLGNADDSHVEAGDVADDGTPSCDDGGWATVSYSVSNTLDKVWDNADLIAVLDVRTGEVVTDQDESGTSLFGLHRARVLQTLKGASGNDQITVGTIDRCLGEGRYVLFLNRTSAGAAGRYVDDSLKLQNPAEYVISGIQGQYQIVDGIVEPATPLGLATGALYRGLSEAEFLAELEALGRARG